MNKLSIKFKCGFIIFAFMATFIWLFSKSVITQDQSYHAFVDTRNFWGIPNTHNVLTNILFVVAGFLGLRELLSNQTRTKKSWFWFFLSIVLVAPGSAYYHLNPNDETLVWDRLPMSMGFMALYIVLLAEHVSFKIEKFLHLALITGLLSIGVWVFTKDLRFYYWIQFSTFLTVPLILFLFPSAYNKRYWYFITLIFYALAKWVEVKDHEVYQLTHEFISGHALKHILAAIGLIGLWWMVKNRSETSEAMSRGTITNPSPTL